MVQNSVLEQPLYGTSRSFLQDEFADRNIKKPRFRGETPSCLHDLSVMYVLRVLGGLEREVVEGGWRMERNADLYSAGGVQAGM